VNPAPHKEGVFFRIPIVLEELEFI
jgi:hypothetical protein